MKIGLLFFVIGVVVAAAAFNDVLPNEDPEEEIGILTSDLKSPQDEMAEETIFRQAGYRTGGKCRRKKGTCISSSDSCNGTVINKGCAANSSCCIKDKDNNSPNDFYLVDRRYFKVFQQVADWDKARQICKHHGWQLAEPDDPAALAEFIYTNVSHYYFWIGARGVGGSFKYLSGQNLVHLEDTASLPSSLEDCLLLQTTNTSYTSALTSKDCNSKYYFICEPPCPKGFFRSGSGCFKVISKSLRWEDAEKNCYREGLQLAEPEDPKTLSKALYYGFGGTTYRSRYWLGARGGRLNSSTFAWNSGAVVPDPYPNGDAWHSGYPRYNTSSYCLQIYTYYHSSRPLYEISCTSSMYSICEMICPLGFFHIGNHCYKAYTSSASSWAQANEICNKAHLTLAEPQDPTAVADYLFTVAGDRNYWLGGRGDGYKFRWSSGEAISSNWAAWESGNPGNNVGTDYCLEMSPEHRSTPLISTTCSKVLYPLCQYLESARENGPEKMVW